MNATQQKNEVPSSSPDFHANLHKDQYALYFWHLVGTVFSRSQKESMDAIRQMQGSEPWATCTDEFIAEVARVGVEEIFFFENAPEITAIFQGWIENFLSTVHSVHGTTSNAFSEDGFYFRFFSDHVEKLHQKEWKLFFKYFSEALSAGRNFPSYLEWRIRPQNMTIRETRVFGQFVLHRVNLLWTGEKEHRKCLAEQRVFLEGLRNQDKDCIARCFLDRVFSLISSSPSNAYKVHYRVIMEQLNALIEQSKAA